MAKIWMLTDGGDWADASARLVAADSGLDMEALRKQHLAYYENEYLPALKRGEHPKYFFFEEWLLQRGFVREPRNDEAEEFYIG